MERTIKYPQQKHTIFIITASNFIVNGFPKVAIYRLSEENTTFLVFSSLCSFQGCMLSFRRWRNTKNYSSNFALHVVQYHLYCICNLRHFSGAAKATLELNKSVITLLITNLRIKPGRFVCIFHVYCV